jgi:hypothetical protein
MKMLKHFQQTHMKAMRAFPFVSTRVRLKNFNQEPMDPDHKHENACPNGKASG